MVYFQLFFILSHYFLIIIRSLSKKNIGFSINGHLLNQDRRKEGRKKGLGQSFALEEEPFQENFFFFF